MSDEKTNVPEANGDKKEAPNYKVTPSYRKLIDGILYHADGKTPIFCPQVPGVYNQIAKGKDKYWREQPVRACGVNHFDCCDIFIDLPELEKLEKEMLEATGKKAVIAGYVRRCINVKGYVQVISSAELKAEEAAKKEAAENCKMEINKKNIE